MALNAPMQMDKIISRLASRKSGIQEYLEDNAPYAVADQLHLEAHTPAHTYWHLGYTTALADALDLLAAASDEADNTDKSTEYSPDDKGE